MCIKKDKLFTFIYIKRDFLRHKTVKTNDEIRRFGVVMSSLSFFLDNGVMTTPKRLYRSFLPFYTFISVYFYFY